MSPAQPAASRHRVPAVFEPNLGQAGSEARFLGRGPDYVLYLTDREAVFLLRGRKPHRPARVRMRLAGSNRLERMEPEAPTGGVSNYFRGGDPRGWRAGIPHFARVACRSVYPGIDLVFYGSQNAVEFDFLVAPGADAGRIRLQWDGVDALRLDPSGDLVLTTGSGELRQRRPRVFQQGAGGRVEIEGRYVLRGPRTVSFQLAAYDASRPLVIDPVLSYSTFLGGSGDDFGARLAVDSAGNAYVTGQTSSLDFPASTGAVDTSANGGDEAFVTKLNAAGSAVLYSTFLGGSGSDSGAAIAVDSAGNAYVTGRTDSANFPTTPGAFQTSPAGGYDVFVAKINPTGTALVYSTLLGGTSFDAGRAIAVDGAGNAYVAGVTLSAAFPTTPSAYDTSPNGGADAFVAKLNAAGNNLVYSTLLGGSSDDAVEDLALDAAGNVYVTGSTSSANFPATAGAYDTTFNGGSFPSDVFVTKLNPTGTALVYSTFLGSSGDEWGYRIAVDYAGSAYVAGMTWSGSFPSTSGAYDPSFNGVADGFVTKLNAAGTSLVYSTFLGGSDSDSAIGLAVDASGAVYVSGQTASANFPTTANALDATFNGLADGFLAKLDAAGSTLLYSSFLGGAGYDSAPDLALDAAGSVYVAGYTFPVGFPVTPGAYDTVWNGGFDAFVLKQPFGPAAESVNPSAGSGSSQTFSFLFSDPDGYQNIVWTQIIIAPGLATSSSCWLYYARSSNQIYLRNDNNSAWLGPLTLGVASSLQNSQCALNGAASSASGSGSNLTLNLAFSFLPAYAGAKGVYMSVADGTYSSGWVELETRAAGLIRAGGGAELVAGEEGRDLGQKAACPILSATC